jgi:two-component system response regulator PilR (NtrC family)
LRHDVHGAILEQPCPAYRDDDGRPVATEPAAVIEDLDALSPAAQRWLGEAMSEGRYLPPGASEPHPFEARVIACARCSPEELLARGADPILIERLGAFTLRVPPLRERRDELPDLAARSLATIARAWGVAPPALSDDAVRAVVAAPWEGNLRELRAVLERAWMGVGRTVTAASLAAARATPTRAAVEPAPASLATPDDDARLAASERTHVERVLRQTDFHISAAARLLGISRSKLYDRVHLWGLDLAAMRAASV